MRSIPALVLTLLVWLPFVPSAAAFEQKVAQAVLDNGMQVVVVSDHRAPVVTHMVWYRVGAADETPRKSGIAHFLEHLMFKGTTKIPPGEFSKIISRNGGDDNAFTSLDYTAYFQRVAKDRLPLVMELEADRMTNLVLTDAEVLPERDVVLEERRSRTENNPMARLGEQMNAAFYLSHPYGQPVIGWPHEIRALNRQDALEFYRRFYAPNNAILIVAGDVTLDDVLPLAKKHFGPIAPSEAIGDRLRPQEPEHQASIRVRLEDPRATAPTMQRSYIAPSYSTASPGEAEALDVMAEILGGGTTSRLYEALVVRQRAAAVVGSYFSGDALDNGRIGVYAVASPGRTAEDVEAELDKVISTFVEKGVTEEELNRAKNSLIAEAVYAQDSQSRMARIYGVALTTGQTVEDVQQWPARIEAVTAEQVRDVARKYLQIERSVTGVLLKADRKGETSEKS